MLLDFCPNSWSFLSSDFLFCFFGIEVAMSGMLKLFWGSQRSYGDLVEWEWNMAVDRRNCVGVSQGDSRSLQLQSYRAPQYMDAHSLSCCWSDVGPSSFPLWKPSVSLLSFFVPMVWVNVRLQFFLASFSCGSLMMPFRKQLLMAEEEFSE